MFLIPKKGVSFMQQLPTRFALACAIFTAFTFTLLAQGPTEFFQEHEVSAHEALVKFRAVTEQSLVQLAQDEDLDVIEAIGGTGVHLLHSRTKGAATLVSP